MAEVPVVRNLNDVISTIGQSVQPLKAQYDADIAANETAGQAQVAGLEAKKVRAFGDIEQGAQNKNMFFSGFSPDSQARYTADTYLPALASLQQTIASTRSNLMKEKLGLDRDVFNKAYDTVEQDRSVLNDWNKMTAQQQFEASESDKQRVFQAQQSEAERNFTAGQNAANRAASAAEGAANRAASASSGGGKDNSGIVNGISAAMEAKKGKDGKVSPATFQQQRNVWVANGGSADAFNQTYFGYVNTGQQNKYL